MMPQLIKVFEPIIDTSYFLQNDLIIFLVWLLCAFLFVALTIFFSFHIFLVFNCMSTIEFREKKNNSEDHVRHRFLVAHVKYDGGKWRNFIHVFGPVWLWLIPVSPSSDPLDDGTYQSDPHKRDAPFHGSDTEGSDQDV